MILYYIFTINAAAFLLMGADKALAKAGARRIREALFFVLAAAGASPGVFFGMKLFHHKTLHRSFSRGIPLMMLIQAALLLYAWRSGVLQALL